MRPASEVARSRGVEASPIEILAHLLDESDATPVMFGVPITKEFRAGMRKLFAARDAEVRAAALEEAKAGLSDAERVELVTWRMADAWRRVNGHGASWVKFIEDAKALQNSNVAALATRSTEEPAPEEKD